MVLLRPKSPGNVGSVARAMKNMGFGRLVIADPIQYDDPAHFDAEARRMAWNAADLLDGRVIAGSLAAALADSTLVAGTGATPVDGAHVLSPRELAEHIAAHVNLPSGGNAVLLLGQEDIGLTHDAMARCHLIGRIPSATAYPSLNLAQAALLFLYELRLALLRRDVAPPPDELDPPRPTHERLEAFYARLEAALDAVDFFDGTGRDHMMRELRLIFNRTFMTSRELAIFEGIVHQIIWRTGGRS